MKFLYQKLLKPILFKFSPDSVHTFFVYVGRTLNYLKPIEWIVCLMYGRAKSKRVVIDGINYKGVALLSAGFDYNAHIAQALDCIGFAGQEVGSVTAKPCKGNPGPNLKRLIQSQSIQVYKGLKNDGVDVIIQRLKKTKLPKDFVLGMSIARTNSKDAAGINEGIEDYFYSYKRLNEENIGDFYTINISCPNAFGGEDFARADYLEQLIKKLKEVNSTKPIYFKLPINKSWEDLSKLIEVIEKHNQNGIVIGNLNKNYQDLDHPEELSSSEFRGGLSGRPCKDLSTALIKEARSQFPNLTIIGCGGIITKEDAMEKINAGADLIQLISGMIFNGPHLINEINQEFSKLNK